jgi:hypothetical protein
MTLHGKSRDGELAVVNNDGIGYGDSIDSSKSAHIVFGGNANDVIHIYARAAEVFNPNNFMDVLITIQTTNDAFVQCDV